MRPTGNHLHVREEITTQLNGIHLPQKTRMDLMLGRPRVFRVLAMGPGKLTRKGILIPMEVEIGDRIIVHSYTAGPVEIGDGTAIITSEEITAVIPKGTP